VSSAGVADAHTRAPYTDDEDEDEDNGHNDLDDVGLAYLQSSKVHVSTFSQPI
jgi:hypothetical protein